MMKRNSIKFAGLLITQPLLLTLLLMGLLVWGLQATPVYAATINVDDAGTDSATCGASTDPCRTIPYALANRAVTGDTVFVWEGTYTETFTLRAGIVISGAGATRTFIDGEGVRGPMVSASGSAIGSSTVLRGVTIRRGTATNGGGVFITNGASPLIEDCIVSENTATSSGGGLYVFGSAALTLRDTEVLSNTSTSAGGGMYQTFAGAARLDLFECRFENNESTGNNGGGLWIANTVVMTGTAFVNNRAASQGGGIYQSGTAGRAELNGGMLVGNSAGNYHGGGLVAQGVAVLSTTQVVSNQAGQLGGGVWANYLQMTEVLFTDNLAGQRGGGLYAAYRIAMTATSMISNTAFQQGGGVAAERDVTIVNSQFIRNSAFAGAAVWMQGLSAVEPQLQYLTIVSPTVSSAYPTASAILARGQTTATITNTIITGYPYAVEAFVGGVVYEDYNLYYNLGTDFFNENGGVIRNGGHSLYDLDPHFINPAVDDYQIAGESAALDAGSFSPGVTTDISGNPRPINTAQPDAPDIGCYENRDTTVTRAITGTVTFGAVCARQVFTDSADLTAVTASLAYAYPPDMRGGVAISRTYTITATGTGPVSATLTLCYTDNEVAAANVDENLLTLYRYDGSSWYPYSSTIDMVGNTVMAVGIDAFSMWALAEATPNAVHLQSFVVQPTLHGVVLEWETAMEIDTLGFNLYRTSDGGMTEIRLNDSFILSEAPGSLVGAVYQWVDISAQPGIKYTYWLEDVDDRGRSTRHSSASCQLPNTVFRLINLPWLRVERR